MPSELHPAYSFSSSFRPYQIPQHYLARRDLLNIPLGLVGMHLAVIVAVVSVEPFHDGMLSCGYTSTGTVSGSS